MQVGSRYFITARNAGRIFFLRDLIVKFLQSTALTMELNKLERAVLSYTSTDCELALLNSLTGKGTFMHHFIT